MSGRLILACLCLGSLAACSIRAPVPDAPVAALWQQRQAELGRLQSWQLNGRLSLAAPRGALLAGLHWSQRGEAFHIVLTTVPSGQGRYVLSRQGADAGVTLRTPDGQWHRSDSAEALLAEHLRWSLRLDGLRHWLLGLPDPHTPGRGLRWDGDGRLTQLRQHGFQVSILRYQSGPEGRAALPDKLLIRRGQTSLRLVIHQWQVSAGTFSDALRAHQGAEPGAPGT